MMKRAMMSMVLSIQNAGVDTLADHAKLILFQQFGATKEEPKALVA